MVEAIPTTRFSLTDHNGRQVTEADYRGRFLIVYFGFTHCRVVCPRSLTKLSTALAQLGSRADAIVPLYVTVDPQRDTPDVMRRYLEAYPRFTGLTGSLDAIEAAKAAFRVYAQRKADPHDPDGYAVPHTAIAYFMSPDGRYLDHFSDALDEAELVGRISTAIDRMDRAIQDIARCAGNGR